MAFATANVQTSVFGNKKITCGDWTGSMGDAAGTIGVAGGRVWQALFTNQGAEQPYLTEIPVSVSTSGTVTTVTVYNTMTVTTGRFMIIHG